MRSIVLLLLLVHDANARVHAVLDIQVTNLVHETCTYGNGHITVLATGGLPPFNYSWADGPSYPQRSNLIAGSYTCTVTDANSETASVTVDVLSEPYDLTAIGTGVAWCAAPGNLLEDPYVSGMNNTWTVNGIPATLWGSTLNGPTFIFYPDGWGSFFEYPVDDGHGCTGTISGSNGPQVVNWPALSITSVEPSCSNVPIGAIHVQSSGLAPAGLTWVNLIRDDQVLQPQANQPDPASLSVDFVNLEPGYYGIHWWLGYTAEALDPGQCSYDTIWVTVPDLGPTCGSVQGTSFYDLNGDCVKDPNEVGVPYSTLSIQPGNEVALTDGAGRFAFGLFNGNYTLEQTDPTLVPICPAVQPVPFSVSGNASVIDLANGSTQPLDLRASLSAGVLRPGFATDYHLHIRNNSPQMSGPVTVTLVLDPTLAFLSSDPAPTVSGNILTWSLPPLISFQAANFYVTVSTPVGTALGTPLTSTLAVNNTLPDGNTANDSDVSVDVVVGSFDPNDKRAVTSSRASDDLYFIDADEWIDYTIRFQNTGTFPAEFVVITDTIASELDMLSFEQGAASHPFSVSFKPGRVIEWRFDAIQLPDSASDEPGSHGLMKFRLKPRLPLAAGTAIENIANIFFDYNEPIITEPSILVAEFSTAILTPMSDDLIVSPIPASEQIRFQFPGTIERLSVITADGRVIFTSRPQAADGIVDIATLPSGCYLLQVRTSQGSVYCRRFVRS
ncbi:MAG: T9SS type A sorting domain-containing protein [Flavobacteriales bacterium]|nr:T9SS type A sorting domain-containing protein [Flavobacteriales bacterium]